LGWLFTGLWFCCRFSQTGSPPLSSALFFCKGYLFLGGQYGHPFLVCADFFFDVVARRGRTPILTLLSSSFYAKSESYSTSSAFFSEVDHFWPPAAFFLERACFSGIESLTDLSWLD